MFNNKSKSKIPWIVAGILVAAAALAATAADPVDAIAADAGPLDLPRRGSRDHECGRKLSGQRHERRRP